MSQLGLMGAGPSGSGAASDSDSLNKAAQFTAANTESLSIADNASLSFAAEDYSVCGWVYYDSFAAGFNGILGKYAADGGAKEYFLAHRRNTNVWEFGDYRSAGPINGQVTISQTANVNTWYFLCAGHDTVTSELWISVNGSAKTTLGDSGDVQDSTAEFSVGILARGAENYVHDGRIDSVGVWRKTLSADEITSLYNAGAGKKYSDLTAGEKTSLEAWWDLKEESGTREDAHGSNDLTDNNTVTQANGVTAGNFAAQFTVANTEFLSIADNASLSFADQDFSFAAWVYLDSKATHRTIIAKYTDANPFEYAVNYNSNNDRFHLAVSSNGTSQTDVYADTLGIPATATWYFVYAYHDSVNNLLGISVNDGTVDTVAHTTGCNDNTSAFMLGAENTIASPTFAHDGRLDSVGVWGKVLSSAEVTSLYNSGNGKKYSDLNATELTSLISWWDLAESSGTRSDAHGSNNLADNNTVTQAVGVTS